MVVVLKPIAVASDGWVAITIPYPMGSTFKHRLRENIKSKHPKKGLTRILYVSNC